MSVLVPAQQSDVPEVNEFGMGRILSLPEPAPFGITEEMLKEHVCVLGRTRSGKSKFLELLMRYLMVHGSGGFCLIDPHGDLSEDLLAYAGHWWIGRGDQKVFPRIHYLEPSFEQVFQYDPFRFQPLEPIPEHLQDGAYRSWLHTKVKAVSQVLQRKQGQYGFEGMPRLERVLENTLTATATGILTAVGMAYDPRKRRHLPFADALVLLDPLHERYDSVLDLVAPHLDSHIRGEFVRWRSMSRQQKYDALLREQESTINRLRSFLSPLVKSIFAGQAHSIDFDDIIQKGEILLVNLRQTNYFSADQGQAIGGLFIHELLSTAQNTKRELRKQFYLLIDEAPDFVGEDIDRALSIMGKFKMSVCLAAQNLLRFKKGELDLRPSVLSQCGLIATFNQRWPEDLEILARVLGMGNIDFRKHYQIVDRPDGYEFVDSVTFTRNFTNQESWGLGRQQGWQQGRTEGWGESESEGRNWNSGIGRMNAFSTMQSVTESQQTNWAEGDTVGTADGRGGASGWGANTNWGGADGQGVGSGMTMAPLYDADHNLIGQTPVPSSTLMNTHGSFAGGGESTTGQESWNHIDNASRSEMRGGGAGVAYGKGDAVQHGTNEMEMTGGNVTATKSTNGGVSSGTSGGTNANLGGGQSEGAGVSVGKTPLAVTREEHHETPSLLNAVSDQLERMMQQLHGLPKRCGVALRPGSAQSVVFETAEVKEVWAPEDKFRMIATLKRTIAAQKPYFTVPDMSEQAQEKRLDDYLLGTKDAPQGPSAPAEAAPEGDDPAANWPGQENPYE